MNNFTQNVFVFSKKILNGINPTFVLLALLLLTSFSYGQVSVTTTTPITQNFNGLSSTAPVTWTDNTTPLAGWYSTVTTLNPNTGSTNTNGVYNCGSTSATDRALGALSTATTHNFGIRLKNNNANAITSLLVSYNGEQWRQNAGNQTLVFEYQIGTTVTSITAGTWVPVTALDFVSPNIGTAGALDGNLTANRTAKSATISLSIPAGSEIMLRWTKAGSSSHLLAVDDLSITPTFFATSITSTQSGNWSNPATWVGNTVPTSADNVIIASGHVVTMDTTTGGINTRNSGTTTTVDAGGTLATSVTYTNSGTTTINGTFQINQGGFGGGAGTWTYGASSTLVFNHTGGTYGPIDSTHTYWPSSSGPVNVTVANSSAAGINLGVSRTVTGVFQTAGNVQGTVLNLNGTIRINSGGAFSTSPVYGNASTLIYNTGGTFGRASEWNATSGTVGTTAGYPNNVQISNSTTLNFANGSASTFLANGIVTIDSGSSLYQNFSGGNAGLTVGSNVIVNGNITLGTSSGDLTLGGSLTVGATANFSTNGRAVNFNGATGNQTITKTGTGIVAFDYLVVNKAAGNVVISSSPATDITVNATSGNVLQLINAGSLDLNGRTLTMNNSGGSIYVNGSRTITSAVAGGKLDITNYKVVANNAGTGSLTLAANVIVNLNANGNLDFGKSGAVFITTLNGTLSINSTTSCFVNTNPPIYGVGSLLKYNSGGTSYGRGVEWSTTSGAGYPSDIQVSNNTTLDVPNTAGAFSTNLALSRNLTIDSGSSLYMDYGAGAASGSLTVGGNVVISGNLSLGDAVGGDMNVAGNWTRTGVFSPNSRLVTFNGTAAQTLTGATTFEFLTLNNTTGLTLQASSAVTVNQTLALTNGKLTIGANNLTVSGALTGANSTNYVVTNSTGQLRRPVSATAVLFATGNTVYNPITFTNSGTSDIYGVSVANTVPAGINSTKTITRQWITTEAVAGGSNLAVVAQYNTGETGAGFAAATDNFIGHYNGTTWSQVSATHAGSNPFTVSSNTNLSPVDMTTGTQYFAIGRDNAFLSVPSRYVLTAITPASPTAGVGFSATVSAQDAYGASTTLSANSSFTLTSNGNAGTIAGTTTGTINSGSSSVVVTGIILPNAGTGVTLTATNSSGVVLSAATSSSFNVLAAATQLAFVGVPATGNVGVNLTTFTVEARRPDNSVDNTFTGTITISKATGTGNLTGTLSATAVAGIATFAAAQFDAASTYTLNANSGSLTQATSSNIVVTLAPVVLAAWDFFGAGSATSNPTTYAATTFNSNLDNTGSLTDITRGAGASPSNGSNSFRTTGFQNNGISTSNTDYFQTTLKTDIGYSLNLSLITANLVGTATFSASPGVSNQFAYSLDGTNFTLINSPVIVSGTTPATMPSINLTGVTALQNIPSGTTVYFRFYASGQTTTGGWGFSSATSGTNGLAFNGNVLCVEPIAYNVTGGGAICSTSTTSVSLSGSQLGINYQLKRDGNNVGSVVAGTGSAISFTNLSTAGTYTVEATNNNGTCNLLLAMTGSAIISVINPATITTQPQSQTVCEGSATVFTVALTGSTSYSYEWKKDGVAISGAPDLASYTIASTAIADAAVYSVDVFDDCLNLISSNNATLTVTPQVTPAFTQVAPICNGGALSSLPTTSNNGVIGTWSPAINNTATTTYTFTPDSGQCASIVTMTIVVGTTTTWTITSPATLPAWDNGVPTSTMTAIIAANYSEVADIDACTLTVNNNAVVTIPSGNNVTLSGALTVASGSSFTLNNNANLVQTTDVANSGNITVRRTTNPLMRFDYVMWSSPVDGTQSLLNFSPLTSVSPTVRFYTYNSSNDQYVSVASPSTTEFQNATGYLIRLPFNHPTAPAVWNGSFVGQPNNGPISLGSLTSGLYYATGNPYPSTIDADDFIATNNLNDALYFWRKTNGATGSAYATYTLAGGATPSPGTGASPTSAVPNGTIQVGQGFLAKATSTSFEFNNQMRIANNANQTFRSASSASSTATVERNRIWLNLSNATATIGQTMVSYMTGATNGIDAQIDGKYINDSQTALTSIITGQEFAIQGKTLPFDATDIVPLGFKTETEGNFSISLYNKDGLFASTSQGIYLRDNQTGAVHDLNSGAYTFTSTIGTFNNRFEVIYQNTLNVDTPTLTSNNVIVYNNNNVLTINTGIFDMASVKVFDIRGRLLTEKTNINATQTTLNVSETNQILLVQVTSNDGIVVTKKVVN
ncbi:T9SS sorting signal type C domain-containing protein [Flavobacterium sp.]|uniref:T9SS sorting signal type C domain-containing protein n=1 Tax=Flavobacterium sp. TaxID=239 RepID=UPI0026167356|nr:T9SS sorting signal type C domain-containing protein [Flavobacterium sp.]